MHKKRPIRVEDEQELERMDRDSEQLQYLYEKIVAAGEAEREYADGGLQEPGNSDNGLELSNAIRLRRVRMKKGDGYRMRETLKRH